jgi:phage terminase large subunit-like protein
MIEARVSTAPTGAWRAAIIVGVIGGGLALAGMLWRVVDAIREANDKKKS